MHTTYRHKAVSSHNGTSACLRISIDHEIATPFPPDLNGTIAIFPPPPKFYLKQDSRNEPLPPKQRRGYYVAPQAQQTHFYDVQVGFLDIAGEGSVLCYSIFLEGGSGFEEAEVGWFAVGLRVFCHPLRSVLSEWMMPDTTPRNPFENLYQNPNTAQDQVDCGALRCGVVVFHRFS